MPDTQTNERPGSAYLDTVTAGLDWASRYVTIHGAGPHPAREVTGAHLVADVLEFLARLGVLAGEEHHHETSLTEAREFAQWLYSLCPPESVAARRYGPTGHGIDRILTGTDHLEIVVQCARAGAGPDAATRRAIDGARTVLTRWMTAQAQEEARR